ncbi:hypothetical protein V5799_031500 [Amblyomma americanum]|uniref:Uncharacterized protein n=1 Tax=Amblyomma americanum TaxID=6943 RepID=A0AAQ4EKN5_AMBAM
MRRPEKQVFEDAKFIPHFPCMEWCKGFGKDYGTAASTCGVRDKKTARLTVGRHFLRVKFEIMKHLAIILAAFLLSAGQSLQSKSTVRRASNELQRSISLPATFYLCVTGQ